MSVGETATTREVIQELLRRIGEGDPDRIAELYAERVDWLLDWPETEHGRAATPWAPSLHPCRCRRPLQ